MKKDYENLNDFIEDVHNESKCKIIRRIVLS